jgi:hypothetical protein
MDRDTDNDTDTDKEDKDIHKLNGHFNVDMSVDKVS